MVRESNEHKYSEILKKVWNYEVSSLQRIEFKKFQRHLFIPQHSYKNLLWLLEKLCPPKAVQAE